MITLQCKLEPEDYIKAQYLHMQPSPWLKYLGIALLSLCLVIVAASVPSSVSLATAISVFAPILLLGVIYGFMLLFIIPWNVRRIFAQQKTLHLEYQTVISPEMIESTSENGTMRMRLSDFHKYKVGKDLILLYHSQIVFHMFPRRFFASEEDFNTFLSYLEANLGSPKR
jgi:YcxB-like protein